MPTRAPVTEAPTTAAPTTGAPVTAAPTTAAPTTEAPTTAAPTTAAPTTAAPTTAATASTRVFASSLSTLTANDFDASTTHGQTIRTSFKQSIANLTSVSVSRVNIVSASATR